MKLFVCAVLSLALFSTGAISSPAPDNSVTVVQVPHMNRASSHLQYVHALLELSLESTRQEFGEFEIRYHSTETLPERQLKGLEAGEQFSVTVSHAKERWNNAAIRVPFPLVRGLASYRLFFTTPNILPALNKVSSLKDFYQFSFGQGVGWSTSRFLEDKHFRIVYGSRYEGLFVMLTANRFDLLMRSPYELTGEHVNLSQQYPSLTYSTRTAMLTYLPMYFYVSDKQPELAARIEKGLKTAFQAGQLDALYEKYFHSSLALIHSSELRVFWINNTNITTQQYLADKPYLLPSLIKQLEPHFETQPQH